MKAAEILGRASGKGITVFLDGDRVSFRGEEVAVQSILPELKEHKDEIKRFLKNNQGILHQLESFRLDAIPDTPETERINNMAWEFMHADGMTYAEAIRAASEIATHCRIAACEATYENVCALWDRLKVVP